MTAFRDRPRFRNTKFHKVMIKWSLYCDIWRFYTNHCEKCGAELCDWRGVETCKNCELI